MMWSYSFTFDHVFLIGCLLYGWAHSPASNLLHTFLDPFFWDNRRVWAPSSSLRHLLKSAITCKHKVAPNVLWRFLVSPLLFCNCVLSLCAPQCCFEAEEHWLAAPFCRSQACQNTLGIYVLFSHHKIVLPGWDLRSCRERMEVAE